MSIEDQAPKAQQRYRELKQELAAGQEQLTQLDQQREALERTLLRISGAIQVLEEIGITESEDSSRART